MAGGGRWVLGGGVMEGTSKYLSYPIVTIESRGQRFIPGFGFDFDPEKKRQTVKARR